MSHCKNQRIKAHRKQNKANVRQHEKIETMKAESITKMKRQNEVTNNVQQAFARPAQKKSWLKRIFA